MTTTDPPVDRFLIVATPRSGSSYLCSLLDSHERIACHYELFHGDEIYHGFDEGRFEGWTLRERDAAPFSFLSDVWRLSSRNARVAGFKIFPGHNEQVLKHLLRSDSVRKIVLGRRNHVRQYVSLRLAEKTGQWSITDEEDREAPVRIHLNPDRLIRSVRERQGFYGRVERILDEQKQPWTRIDYEQLADDSVRQCLLEFLGVEPRKLRAETRKQGTYALPEVIRNYGELTERLEGTRLHRFLE